MTPYLDTPDQWKRLAEGAMGKTIGLDSETYGHDIKVSTPAYRAKIHVWSVGMRTNSLSPRGYHVCRGAVLPVAALECKEIVQMLESPEVQKVAHNSHHDQHAFHNHGIMLQAIRDNLETVRLAWPERGMDKTLGYRLKPLAMHILGKPKRDEFKDITEEHLPEKYWVRDSKCACGDPKCRKRKTPHDRTVSLLERVRIKHTIYPLESIVPGHKQWERLLDYAAADAVDALELDEMATKRLGVLDSRRPELPW